MRMRGLLAFKDVNAQAPEHFLVIPKDHISNANDATDEALMGRLSITAANIAKEHKFSSKWLQISDEL